jgi:hypothetical protein
MDELTLQFGITLSVILLPKQEEDILWEMKRKHHGV